MDSALERAIGNGSIVLSTTSCRVCEGIGTVAWTRVDEYWVPCEMGRQHETCDPSHRGTTCPACGGSGKPAVTARGAEQYMNDDDILG